MAIGLTLPFARSTGSVGYFEFTSDEFSAIRYNLTSLLLTNWGERVMHFKFGCNLIEFLFEQRTHSLRERVADRVMSQVATWMPFVTLDKLHVIFSEDTHNFGDFLVVPENGIGFHIGFKLTSRPDFSSLFNHVVVP